MELIYNNCCDYNGEDSEYYELAADMRKLFHTLVKVHIEGDAPEDDDDECKGKKGRKRDSRSSSACHTPEMTSESSSEEESDGDGRQVALVHYFVAHHACTHMSMTCMHAHTLGRTYSHVSISHTHTCISLMT